MCEADIKLRTLGAISYFRKKRLLLAWRGTEYYFWVSGDHPNLR
jgi:hypothetical protein